MVISAAMLSEGERIPGSKNARSPLRTANWWGSELSPVYYDGRKVLIERPRLGGRDNKEIPLVTYRAFKAPRGMKMVLGISSRNYEEAVEGVIRGYGIKKSSVSRHFVQVTAEQMREFMERDLSGFDLLAIFIDSLEFKGQVLAVALGLARGGREHILGLWQGATENATVCTRLLEEMVRRGLEMTKAYLLRTERKFRRVRGYREIHNLIAALQHKSLDRKEVAA